MSLSGRRSRCIPASLTIRKKLPSPSSFLLRFERGLLTMTPRFSVVIDGFEVNFYLGGGIVGWIGKFFFPFLLSSLGIS